MEENMLSAILSHIGDNSLEAISQQVNASPDQTKSALASAIPILMNALAKNSQSPEGAASLQNALQRDHDGSLLDNLGGFLSNPEVGNGAGILRHVLGDKRQNVENYVSSDAGVGKSAAGKILEMAAPIVMGYLGKKFLGGGDSNTGGGIGNILGSFLNHENEQAPRSQSVINQILDKNNDGNVVDDIAELGMSFLGRLFNK
jgi:hypothetical protein